MGTACERLAVFCAGVSFDDLPDALVGRTRRHILDTFGAALAGSAALESREVVRMLAAESGAGGAPVWGTPLRLGSRDAAFANGVAAHALELDDTGGCDHSGAVVLPAVLAALSAPMASGIRMSGRDLLVAVVVGYEVGRRVLEACGGYSAHNGAGWHSTATCGTLAAAAAASRLLKLDAAQMASALGHAASASGGLWAFIHDASQTKRLHAGRAAEAGLTAALLAARGISGPARVFDDAWGGFFNAFAPQSGQPEALLSGLGDDWRLLRCAVKPYASCRSTHATIDAVLQLMAWRPGLARQVRRIDVRLSAFVAGMCGGRDLSTLSAAQMSLPYAVAVAWVFGAADLSRYLAPVREDPRLVAAMSLVRLHPDASMAALDEPTVTVTSTDGEAFSLQVPVALGAPANPMSDTQLRAKFDALARIAVSADGAAALSGRVLALDRLDDARALLPLLAGRSERHALLN